MKKHWIESIEFESDTMKTRVLRFKEVTYTYRTDKDELKLEQQHIVLIEDYSKEIDISKYQVVNQNGDILITTTDLTQAKEVWYNIVEEF